MRPPILLLLASCSCLAAAGAQEAGSTILPETRDWGAVEPQHWDAGRALPRPEPAELEARGRRGAIPDLNVVLGRLAELRFPAPADGRAPRWRNFGDLAVEFRPLRADARATDDLLAELERAHPAIWAEVGPWLPELVRADYLYSAKWKSKKDSERDGMLHGQTWQILDDERRAPCWRDMEGDPDVYQTAMLLFADFEDSKRSENDYAGYIGQEGRDYEWIHAKRDHYFCSRPGASRPFVFLEVAFETDIPFPFGTILCDLKILDGVDDQGRIFTEIYSLSEDFHWFAARDTYIPVRSSDGQLVGNFVVSHCGFDVDGVPDGESDRKKTIRGALGAKKIAGEKLFEQRQRHGAAGSTAGSTAGSAALGDGSSSAGRPPAAGPIPILPVTGAR